MKKSDLVEALAKKYNLTAKQAMEIVDIVFDGFTNELKNAGRVVIRRFGSFSVREYESYTGRNPRTGNAVQVKPKRLPFFKVERKLKKMVDSK